MDEAWIDRAAQKVIDRLISPTVELEASGRHVHLTRQAVEVLFGPGYRLNKLFDLSQPGQFACKERVAVAGTKKTIQNVIVLGPERSDTQVEVSATDALALGIEAPLRQSGDIGGTPGARLIGSSGEMELSRGVIVALRHIHMTPEDARCFGVEDRQTVDVLVEGDRAMTFHKVLVRASPSFATYMHIDYDEANACGFVKGMRGVITLPINGR